MLSYLALGDSYTIGEAVEKQLCFPFQLAEKFNASVVLAGENKELQLEIAEPFIIAKTGWTTDDLQSAIQTANLNTTYDMVTLLIGVNNQYRGYAIAPYRLEFRALLQKAVALAGGRKNRVFVISIPDWGITPFGLQSGRGEENIAKEIDAFNAVNKEESLNMGISYTDITPGSREAKNEATLTASDGLHPSGKMYENWVNQLLPTVIDSLH